MATEAALEAVCSLAAESRLVDLLAPGWAGGGSILRSRDKSGHCPRAVPRQVWTQRGGSCVSPCHRAHLLRDGVGYVSLRDLCELLSPGGAETMAPSQDSRAPLEFGGPLGNGAVGGAQGQRLGEGNCRSELQAGIGAGSEDGRF